MEFQHGSPQLLMHSGIINVESTKWHVKLDLGVFEVADYESVIRFMESQHGSPSLRMRINVERTKWSENCEKGASGVADYELVISLRGE